MTNVVEAATFGDFTYTDNGASITITGYSNNPIGAVVIPDTIDSKPVTTIEVNAFSYHSGVTGVTIPSSVTSIGNYAFYSCNGLTSVAISSGVTSIGIDAFGNCSALTAITVDELNPNYSGVDGVLFNKSKTTLIAYPGGVNGGYAVPDGVTSIGTNAFYNCDRLTGVTIPLTRLSLLAGFSDPDR